jgi:hypothetical protein
MGTRSKMSVEPRQNPQPNPSGDDASMTSKHHGWQARWEVDQWATLATHETGLRVRLQDGVGVSDNAEEIALALVPAHGAHNAPAMVQRLVREGAQMLIDPNARGWRN